MKSREEKSSQKKEDAIAKISSKKIHTCKMLGKSRNALFFSLICGSAGSKSRLGKAAGAEVAVSRRNEKLPVARSTFSSQNVQNSSGADHFLKFRCRKMAHRCCEKHIFK